MWYPLKANTVINSYQLKKCIILQTNLGHRQYRCKANNESKKQPVSIDKIVALMAV